MQNKKIVFTISSMYSGGAERVMSYLVNFFAYKYDVYLILLCKRKIVYYIDPKVKIIELDLCKNSKGLFKSIKNNINRYKILKHEVQKISPNLIVSFLTQTNILMTMIAKSLKIPIIISERSVYISETNKIWRFLRRIVYPYSDLLVVLTKNEFLNYKFVTNITKIYNPLILKDVELKKEDIILAVGRLHKVKQFEKLIYIFSKLKNHKYKLLILGDGKERKYLENLISQLNLNEKIKLLGHIKNIEEYYAKAKILCLTSKYESFSNVLIEAMGYECAIVSFDCPYGPSEIIDNNIDGILVEDQNIDDFKNKLELLMDDESLRLKFIKNAKKKIKQFEFDNIIKQWEINIDNIIKNNI